MMPTLGGWIAMLAIIALSGFLGAALDRGGWLTPRTAWFIGATGGGLAAHAAWLSALLR